MPGCVSTGAAKRSYPKSEVRDSSREELPHIRGQGGSQRSNPMSKEQRLCGRRRAERSYSTFKVRRGSRVEIPLIQGKEQRLRFAGAAVTKTPHPR